MFADTRYRLACTATPAPNDIEELCNHADFLGVMKPQEMRSTFFIAHSRGEFMRYRLKRHAHDSFYQWLASWACAVKNPSDLGDDTPGFVLPGLSITPHYVDTDYVPDGQLFVTGLFGVTEQSHVRRSTMQDRVSAAVRIMQAEPDETLLIWSAAVVTVVRYAAAFIASDSVTIETGLSSIITYAMGFSGLGTGVLDVFGGAYLFDGWRRVMPRNDQSWPFKFNVLTLFAVGLVVNGVLILIPFTMSRVSGNTMHGILGDGYWLFGWSLVVNIAPYLLIGGVTVGNQIVSIKPEESFGNFPGNFPEPEKLSEKVPQWRTFRKKVSNDELLLITNMVPSVIAQKYGLTVKAAKDWPAYANRELITRGVLKDA